MKHKIIDEFVDGGWVKKTTHPGVDYDELSQVFVVSLDDRNACEVYGADRFEWAIKLADYAQSVSAINHLIDHKG
jgi:hypothetical protein